MLKHAPSGNALDSSDAGGHGAFRNNFEQAEPRGIVHMSAAAEFRREFPGLYYPDDISVFFTEQRHSAQLFRFLNRHFRTGNLNRGKNLVVDDLLYSGGLLLSQSGEMGKVKTHPLTVYQLSRLFHVGAQHLSQRGLEQVGGGMVSHDIIPADAVYHALYL